MIPTRHRTATPRRRPRLTARLAALGAATALAATAVSAVGPGSAPANAAETPAAALTVRLDPGYQHPAFQGWGTALAWFAHVTGGWPAAQRDALADALYGADGLGFTIARYNIGGGDSPETAPYMRAGAAVPGYWNRPGPEAPTGGTRTAPTTGTPAPTRTSAGGSRRPRRAEPAPSRPSPTRPRTS